MGRETGHAIGRGIAEVLAFFGNDTAQAALEAERRHMPERERLEGEIHISVSTDGTRPVVTRLRTNNPGVDLDVDSPLILGP
jgi:hypothetical protein